MSALQRPLPIPGRPSRSTADLQATSTSTSTTLSPAPAPPPRPSDASIMSDDARSTTYSRSDSASITGTSISSSRRVPFPADTVSQLSPASQAQSQTPSPLLPTISRSSQTSASAASHTHATRPSHPQPPPPPLGGGGDDASPPVQMHAPASVPSDPLPDSLLCRSTFAALEHSAGTLKRLAKHVLDRSSEVVALLEQLERAEDEMLGSLGELGRWLEGGYGVKGDVWEDTTGMRKVAREKRRREKEELEAMVVHSLKAVKGEIKRQGLAGNGAQARFENTAKQYYAHTATYLGGRGAGEGSTSLSDQAQAARQAQYDLMRYNHHSTLLYAVPPSSVGCLDLLVGLYGWVGAVLSHSPGKRADTHPPSLEEDFARHGANPSSGAETPTQRGRALAVSETPVRLLMRDEDSVRGAHEALHRTLSLSLAHLVNVRGDLLRGWAVRDHQTTVLEDTARRLAQSAPEPQGYSHSMPTTPGLETPSHSHSLTPLASTATTPHSTPLREVKPKKTIGGKIRGLFTSSSSASLMPTLAERAPPVSSSNIPINARKSVDVSRAVGEMQISDPRLICTTSAQVPKPTGQDSLRDTASAFPMPPPRPPRADGRRSVDVRQSMPLPAVKGRFVADEPLPSGQSRARVLADTAAKLNGAQVGGVGGLDGTEDEERELVGRKKEGVLWGTGAWEALDRDSSRGKWERFWVVLANSSLYEHRDAGPGKPEGGATVIDLKFASVREGRGTDRRFVFEVVTPSHGRRLYQATSEAEMRTWIYTICNAIESCINGTSTVRSSDRRLEPDSSVSVGVVGAGIGATSTKAKRKSGSHKMKQESRKSIPLPMGGEEPRKRRTSLKSRFKHGAEVAGDRLSTVVGGGKRGSIDMERPAFLAQGGRMPSYGTGSMNSRRASWYDDDDIERRVMEMAGVDSSSASSSLPRSSRSRRPGTAPAGAVPTFGQVRSTRNGSSGCGTASKLAVVEAQRRPSQSPCPSPGALEPAEPQLDMVYLRQLAAMGANARCADCGRPTKTSRWATLSLREVPMVMFLCIRCVGLHRGLGTHISKPRSVDLDNWTPDAVLLAHQWGNERANSVWERRKPLSAIPTDDDMADFIQAKYVEGRWLADADRPRFGLGARV